MAKIKILFIHGGETFKSRKDFKKYLNEKKADLKGYVTWSDEYLTKKLGKNFEIIRPKMPLKQDAKYEEWKIWFEKYLDLLDKKVILIGASLGGIFLAKYLSENKVKKKLLSVYIVCPPFDDTIPGEDLVGGFELKKDLSLIMKNCKNTKFLFSKDDDVVPISHLEKYKKKVPEAKYYAFDGKNGHFKVSKFPEIVKMIKQDKRLLK